MTPHDIGSLPFITLHQRNQQEPFPLSFVMLEWTFFARPSKLPSRLHLLHRNSKINLTTHTHTHAHTHGEPPQNIANTKEYVDEALSIAVHAMRAGIHSTLGSSPGSLTYNRDMFLNIPLIADWHAITQRREHLINDNLIRENKKRRRYDYVPQQRVLKKNWKPRKLDKQTSGPYRVIQTHVNGTLTIELTPGVSERINIRRVIPYKEPTAT